MRQTDEDEIKQGMLTGRVTLQRGPDISGMQKRSRGTLDLLFCGSDLGVIDLIGVKYQQRIHLGDSYTCLGSET
jgi:hypothetical protein